ncbi:MAG: hypothetical protein ACRCU3_00045 [Eubacteriaceae bacterium]
MKKCYRNETLVAFFIALFTGILGIYFNWNYTEHQFLYNPRDLLLAGVTPLSTTTSPINNDKDFAFVYNKNEEYAYVKIYVENTNERDAIVDKINVNVTEFEKYQKNKLVFLSNPGRGGREEPMYYFSKVKPMEEKNLALPVNKEILKCKPPEVNPLNSEEIFEEVRSSKIEGKKTEDILLVMEPEENGIYEINFEIDYTIAGSSKSLITDSLFLVILNKEDYPSSKELIDVDKWKKVN